MGLHILPDLLTKCENQPKSLPAPPLVQETSQGLFEVALCLSWLAWSHSLVMALCTLMVEEELHPACGYFFRLYEGAHTYGGRVTLHYIWSIELKLHVPSSSK